jgi:hypothetical protein
MKQFLLLIISILFIEISAQDTPCEAIYFESTDTCFTVFKNNTTYLGSGFVPSCGNYQGGDYWLTTTIPLSGNLTIESSLGLFNSKVNIMVWIGNDCNTLTQISCYPDTATNNILTFSLYNYPVGTLIFLQLFENENNQVIDKLICINNGNQNNTVTDSTFIILPEETQQCINALPFCLNQNYFLPGGTGVISESGPNYGCLGTVPNPTWLYFLCTNSGPLSLNVSTGSGIDVDFITYGPFSTPNFPCSNGLTSNNIIDCSYSTNSPETVTYNNILFNQYYLILLTNYSNVDTYFNVTQTGGTGSFYCVPYNCDATINSSPSCSSFSSGSVSANVIGAYPVNYVWKDENGNTLLSETNAWSIDTVFNLSSGTYTISITTNDGCQIFESIEVDVNKESYFTYSDSLFCINEISILPDSILTLGGVFSSQPNININISTGMIDVSSVIPFQEYIISYHTNNYCGLDSSVYTISFNIPTNNAYFSYDTSVFCSIGSYPIPDSITIQNHANFYCIPNTLSINDSTGELYVNPFTNGVYDIYNVTHLGCKDTATFQVTVQQYIDSYFSFLKDSVCFAELQMLPDTIAVSGGSFNSSTLTIDSSTGLVDLTSGNYNINHPITYSQSGFCGSSTTSLLHVKDYTSDFSYANDTICKNEIFIIPNYVQNQNGYFYSLDNNLIIDSITGNIDITNLLNGDYTIYRVVNDYCVDTSNLTVTIVDFIDAFFTYSSQTYYLGDSDPNPITTNLGGIFSSTPPGLFLNTSTGLINVENSNPGIYLISYITFGGCNDTAFFEVEISYDLSVIDYSNNGNVNLEFFPNPTENSITFRGLKDYSNISVECYDQLGKICFIDELDNSELDVSDLLNGMYFLKVYSNESYLGTKKLIVTKSR